MSSITEYDRYIIRGYTIKDSLNQTERKIRKYMTTLKNKNIQMENLNFASSFKVI